VKHHFNQKVIGVIIAGGSGRRFGGGDKCLHRLGDRSILQHVVERVGPQVDGLVLNVNGDPHRFSQYQLPCIADESPLGPLSGIVATMGHETFRKEKADWLLTVSSDCPFLPENLVNNLLSTASANGSDVAIAATSMREHYLIGLWRPRLEPNIRAYLHSGQASVKGLLAEVKCTAVQFTSTIGDPFFNVNTPQDLRDAERHLSSR